MDIEDTRNPDDDVDIDDDLYDDDHYEDGDNDGQLRMGLQIHHCCAFPSSSIERVSFDYCEST